MTAHARAVDARSGARWFAQGWRLFRVSPLMWVVLVFSYLAFMRIVSIVPFVGVAAAFVLIPAFSVGFMEASRSSEGGRAPGYGQLFSGFQTHLGTQLQLGAIYLGCLVALMLATRLADHGALARWMLAGQRPSDQVLQSDAFSVALLIAGVLYVPVMMAFWFAPVLAAWHGLGAGKALFFSFFAVLINWRAFLVYGAVALLVSVMIPNLVLSVLSLVVGHSVVLSRLLLLMLMVVLLTLIASFYASFYASYRDVFASHE